MMLTGGKSFEETYWSLRACLVFVLLYGANVAGELLGL